jgi:hypothetical protein
MSDDDDDDTNDDLLKTVQMHAAGGIALTHEIEMVLGELDDLLKNGDLVSSLAEKGVNASVALLASQALAAYLRGDKAQAADDFQAVAEEIRDRLSLSKTSGDPKAN